MPRPFAYEVASKTAAMSTEDVDNAGRVHVNRASFLRHRADAMILGCLRAKRGMATPGQSKLGRHASTSFIVLRMDQFYCELNYIIAEMYMPGHSVLSASFRILSED